MLPSLPPQVVGLTVVPKVTTVEVTLTVAVSAAEVQPEGKPAPIATYFYKLNGKCIRGAVFGKISCKW